MRRLLFGLTLLAAAGIPATAQDSTGTVGGVVLDARGLLIPSVAIELRENGTGVTRSTRTGADGAYRIAGLFPGIYRLTARRVGYQTMTRDSVIVIRATTTKLDLLIEASVTALDPVRVTDDPIGVDPGATDFGQRLSASFATRLPTGRDAGSLLELLPGVSRNMVWGGGGVLANSYRLDGLALTHPGLGGDLVSPALEWMEGLEVSGLGAGAAFGNFQGGVINAVTKTGTNVPRAAARMFLDSRRFTGPNPNLTEEGFEQAFRRELVVDASGPIALDRLYYFAGAQVVQTAFQLPDLTSAAADDYRADRTMAIERRGFGKLTWTPDPATRLEAVGLLARRGTERLGLNGYDDPIASRRYRGTTAAFQASVVRAASSLGAFEFRIGGVTGADRFEPYDGPSVPAVQTYRVGLQPSYQNAAFTESTKPSTYAAQGRWLLRRTTGGMEHNVDAGVEGSLGYWRHLRSRSGGVTWRPFAVAGLDPTDASTWGRPASEWGGAIHLDSRVTSASAFVDDRMTLGRLTVTPGLRVGHWEGMLDPAGVPAYRAVQASGLDPRIGAALDPLGTRRLVLKAHWGIYHQGMAAALFDRVGTTAPYQDERFYYDSPAVGSSRTPWTDAQRDEVFIRETGRFVGQPLPSLVRTHSEAGRLERYRQPYLRQFVGGAEFSWRGHWNLEAMYVQRTNHDFVGLVDRNLATNYTALHNVGVGLVPTGQVAFEEGKPLVLPTVYIRNDDLYAVLSSYCEWAEATPPPGTNCGMLSSLTYEPDLVFTTIDEARRKMQQAHVSLAAVYDRWAGRASITRTTLAGNVAGVTGLGGVGSAATAGQWVRPNEAANSFGNLGGFSPIESKIWLEAKLADSYRAGFTVTHLMGEWFSHDFAIEFGRYRLTDGTSVRYFDPELFTHVGGQAILVEPAGSRHYADRTLVDLRVERVSGFRGYDLQLTADVTNVLGTSEVTLVHSRINDALTNGASVRLGAPRLRTAPRLLRVGLRIGRGSTHER